MESILVFFAVLFSSASVFANDATIPMIVLEANQIFAGEMAGYQIALIVSGIALLGGLGIILGGFPGLLVGGAIGFALTLNSFGNTACTYNVQDKQGTIHTVTLKEHSARKCTAPGKVVYIPASSIKQSQPQQ